MPIEDAHRWNARYLDRDLEKHDKPRRLLVRHSNLLPEGGLALDVAMGLGANAGFLLARGLKVVGVDIASVAVRQAKASYSGLYAVIADLAHFYLAPDTFDVILNFYYLQRDLWPRYARALRPGGLLFLETFQEDTSQPPTRNPEHLLKPGELKHSFPNLEILHYGVEKRPGRRGLEQSRASLIARKPRFQANDGLNLR